MSLLGFRCIRARCTASAAGWPRRPSGISGNGTPVSSRRSVTRNAWANSSNCENRVTNRSPDSIFLTMDTDNPTRPASSAWVSPRRAL